MYRRILKTIHYIHSRGLIHNSLDKPSNYVIQEGELKLINIGCLLDKNIDPAKARKMKREDFKQFRKLLKDRMPKNLEGRQLFMEFFDKPEE